MQFTLHFLIAAVLFVAIDSIWLALVANTFYKQELKGKLRDKPAFAPAAIFYVLYMLGLVFFAVDPALAQNSLQAAYLHGAFLGLVMYATYDLTNLSTLKGWSTKLVIVDMSWGALITAVVSSLTYLIFT